MKWLLLLLSFSVYADTITKPIDAGSSAIITFANPYQKPPQCVAEVQGKQTPVIVHTTMPTPAVVEGTFVSGDVVVLTCDQAKSVANPPRIEVPMRPSVMRFPVAQP